MVDLVRLRRWTRVLALCCLVLGVLAAYGWLRSRAVVEVPIADGDSEALRARISAAGFAERVRMLHRLGRSGDARSLGAVLELLRQAQTDRVRRVAIAQLGRIGGETALRELADIASGARATLRGPAIRALGQVGSPRATELLLELLQSPDGTQRSAVIAALGAAGGAEATEVLVRLAGDAAEPQRGAAIAALGSTGSVEALSTLRRLARAADVVIGKQAIAALGEHGTAAAKQLLIDLARSGPARGRAAVARALGNYAGDDIEVVLAGLARSSDAEVARAALHALGNNGGTLGQQALLAVLQGGNSSERTTALRALARSGSEEARGLLVEALADRQLANTAAWELASLGGPEAKAALLSAATSEDASPATQQAVVSALGNLSGPEVERTLTELVDRGNPYVSSVALRQLAQRRGKQAKPMLLKAFKEGSHAVRASALQALAELGDPSASEIFLEAARSGDYSLSHSAVRGLRSIGGPQAKSALIGLLKDAPRSARSSAAYMLSELGGAEARAALLEAVKKGEVGHAAASALARMQDPESRAAIQQLVADPSIASATRMQLLHSLPPGDNGDAIISATRDQDANVAAAAIGALGQTGGVQAERTLKEALAAGDPRRKRAAVGALARLGTPEALAAVAGALDDPQTFDQALVALTSIGGKSALGAVNERFGSSSAEQRRRIVASIGQHADPSARSILRSALTDDDDQVVAQAARALANIGNRDERQQLLSLMQSSNSKAVRYAIARQIRNNGGGLYNSYKQLIDQITQAGG